MSEYDPQKDSMGSYYAAIEAKRIRNDSYYPALNRIDQTRVRSLLEYNPETGVLIWRFRDRGEFKADVDWKKWNTRYSGTRAGNQRPDGYVIVNIKGQRFLAHRLIWVYMTGEAPAELIDHINGDQSDNRFCNLRAASRAENARNAKMPITNSSGCVGVRWSRKDSRWRADISVNGKVITLGSFTTFDEAERARRQASEKYGFHKNHGRREGKVTRRIQSTHSRGERNGQSKLTADQVREIRSLHGTVTQREIAFRFNVSFQTVSAIISRKLWHWLEDAA